MPFVNRKSYLREEAQVAQESLKNEGLGIFVKIYACPGLVAHGPRDCHKTQRSRSVRNSPQHFATHVLVIFLCGISD